MFDLAQSYSLSVFLSGNLSLFYPGNTKYIPSSLIESYIYAITPEKRLSEFDISHEARNQRDYHSPAGDGYAFITAAHDAASRSGISSQSIPSCPDFASAWAQVPSVASFVSSKGALGVSGQ